MLRTPVRETSGRLSFPFKSKITFIKLEFFFLFYFIICQMLYCQKQLTGLECNRGNLKLLLANVQQQENEMHEMGLPVHILDQAAGLDGQNRGPSRLSAGLRRDGGGAHAPQHMQECH